MTSAKFVWYFLALSLTLGLTTKAKAGDWLLGLGLGSISGVSAQYEMDHNVVVDGLITFEKRRPEIWTSLIYPTPDKDKDGAYGYFGIGIHARAEEGTGLRFPLGANWDSIVKDKSLRLSLEAAPSIIIVPTTKAFVDLMVYLRYRL